MSSTLLSRRYTTIIFTKLTQIQGVRGITRTVASEYRTFNGTGNNVEHPSWGSVSIHLVRYPKLLPPRLVIHLLSDKTALIPTKMEYQYQQVALMELIH